MNILPTKRRVFISPYTPDEVLNFLAIHTRERNEYSIIPDKINNLVKFYGHIDEKNNQFIITKKFHHTNIFLPLIHGKLEAIEEGTLINVEYKLLPSTFFFFLFNAIMATLFSIVFFIIGNFSIGIICLLFVICSCLITISNFHLQVKDSHQTLEETLIV